MNFLEDLNTKMGRFIYHGHSGIGKSISFMFGVHLNRIIIKYLASKNQEWIDQNYSHKPDKILYYSFDHQDFAHYYVHAKSFGSFEKFCFNPNSIILRRLICQIEDIAHLNA